MNLPNFLTCLRFVFTVFFIFALFAVGFWWKVLALSLFALASFTDYLDGTLARRWGQTSAFGRLMDPIADKFLTLSAFFSFAVMGLFSFWFAGVVALRDVVVTASRFRKPLDSVAVEPRKSGKRKTALQFFFIIAVLLFLIWRESPFYHEAAEATSLRVIRLGMLLIVALTIWSGLRTVFLKKNPGK